MTEDRLPLAELLAKADEGDFLRTVAESVLQQLMEADVDGLIGAGRHERAAERQTCRNGYRDRAFDTRLGTLQLRIPKQHAGMALGQERDAERPAARGGAIALESSWPSLRRAHRSPILVWSDSFGSACSPCS